MQPFSTTAFLLAFAAINGLAGCGPTFSSAKGTIASTGNAANTWSGSPTSCTNDAHSGANAKALTLNFPRPDANVPARKDTEARLVFPFLFSITEDGSSYKGRLALNNSSDIELSKANCKVFSLVTHEHWKGFMDRVAPLDGRLTLDCKTQESHITADISFEHCD